MRGPCCEPFSVADACLTASALSFTKATIKQGCRGQYNCTAFPSEPSHDGDAAASHCQEARAARPCRVDFNPGLFNFVTTAVGRREMFCPGQNKEVRIGPYLAVGASTYLDKNELQGDQDVKVKDTNGGDNRAELDTERAKIDNDLNYYAEGGLIGNFFRFKKNPDSDTVSQELFLQAIIGYGRYEALTGFNPGKSGFFNDSRNRFIGKLRIFPTFLDTAPDGGADSSPMFGVEINAGRGPDQIKFFTGVATAFKLFSGKKKTDTQ